MFFKILFIVKLGFKVKMLKIGKHYRQPVLTQTETLIWRSGCECLDVLSSDSDFPFDLFLAGICAEGSEVLGGQADRGHT